MASEDLPGMLHTVPARPVNTLDDALSDTATPQPPPRDSEPASGSSQSLSFEPGARIHQYELIRELGRGGMGVVYAARDTKLGRRVAIKFLRNATREIAERFLVEARATAQCGHEHIVIIHDVNEIDGVPFMVLELLDGQTLRAVLDSNRLPVSRVVDLALPIARALARAHDAGIVHRDLKPENVFVTSAGQVKVLDFGVAKAAGALPEPVALSASASTNTSLRLTHEGAILGTLPYMPPEQLGGDDVDHRCDVWALGIILFEMLAGRHPVEPLTASQLLAVAASPDPMPSLRDVRPDVPAELADLVEQCLRKRKDERLASAAAVVAALELQLPGRHGRRLAEGECPYPGLIAFQEADSDRFFGRARDVTRMVAKIRELPLTGVVGPSGVGKSSFVRAGVGPALKASGDSWDVITLRPGRQPLVTLTTLVERLTTRSGKGKLESRDGDLLDRLRREPGCVGAALRERARATGRHVLLFVDQFEELYTLVPDAEERRAFTAALMGVADDAASPLRVVVSMRSDFLDRTAEDPGFAEELTRGLVLLSPPDREGLREALVQPLEMVGYRFETSAMVGDMLDALANASGALPLLQFAAAKLWDARDKDARLLTVSSYHAIGGISGALATHADEVIASMSATAQKLAHKIFRALVTTERTRAIVEVSELCELAGDRSEVMRLVDQLAAARLLVVQTRGDGGGGTVELVHESLIDRWPRLRRWLDEDQEDAAFLGQLSTAAKQWESKGRPAGLLWRGDAMEEARRWYALRPRELSSRDQAFIDAVFALARRGKRVRNAIVVGVFVVLAAIASAALIALVLIRGAEQRATAEAERTKEAMTKMQQEEAQKREAERQRATAEADKARAQAEQAQAELRKQQAEARVEQVEQTSREQLEAENKKLQRALQETTVAKLRADEASAAAEASAAKATQLNHDLEQALGRERDRVKQLEDEKKKLATQLPGK